MYTKYTNASNETIFYTYESLYMVWVHPLREYREISQKFVIKPTTSPINIEILSVWSCRYSERRAFTGFDLLCRLERHWLASSMGGPFTMCILHPSFVLWTFVDYFTLRMALGTWFNVYLLKIIIKKNRLFPPSLPHTYTNKSKKVWLW